MEAAGSSRGRGGARGSNSSSRRGRAPSRSCGKRKRSPSRSPPKPSSSSQGMERDLEHLNVASQGSMLPSSVASGSGNEHSPPIQDSSQPEPAGGKMFTCGVKWSTGIVCDANYSTRKSLTKHKRVQHSAQKCEDCPDGPMFPDKKALDAHRASVHTKAFCCRHKWCNRQFASLLERHNHEQKCKETDRSIKCGMPRCTGRFELINRYITHLETNHGARTEEISELLDLVDTSGDRPVDKSARKRIKEWKSKVPLIATPSQEPAASSQIGSNGPEIPFHEEFGDPVTVQVLRRGAFTVFYDYTKLGPRCVLQRLDKEYLEKPEVAIEQGTFRRDFELPEMFRTGPEDFKGTPFEKGHMAASRCHVFDQDANDLTWIYSNVLPQYKLFNVGVWVRSENRERTFAGQCKIFYSYSGGIYAEDKGKCGRIPVPSHFYKILLGQRESNLQWELESYLMPHSNVLNRDSLDTFLEPLENIESMVGMKFFPNFDTSKLAFVNFIGKLRP